MSPTDATPESAESSPHHAGFVALVGKPNAGKSTLLNQVLGTKLAIVSNKPQTTRNRIVGVHTGDDMQVVLVDTPGIHVARSRMNRAMVQAATAALLDVDAVCWVIDAAPLAKSVEREQPVVDRGLHAVGKIVTQAGAERLCIVLNKVDIVPKPLLLPVLQALSEAFPEAELVPMSALTGDNLEALKRTWRKQLPESPPLFPEDHLTDISERFLVSELIREKVFHVTSQEIPYSTAVEIEQFEEAAPRDGQERGHVTIYAKILVERDGQKRIVVGKGGAMIKRIGIMARKEIQSLLGTGVHLELHVSVNDNWTTSPRTLRQLGIE